MGGDSDLVKNFDEFADVTGSSRILTSGRHLDDVDGAVQGELAVAKKFKDEGVIEFAPKPAPGVEGDIDVVTRLRAYEVKAGDPGNFNRQKLEDQFKKLTLYAKNNGDKTPVLAIKEQYFPIDENAFAWLFDLAKRYHVTIEKY